MVSSGGNIHHFEGANKPIYAPEPLDVGKILRADVVSDSQTISVTTVATVDPAPGLTSYVQSLQRRSNAEFHVMLFLSAIWILICCKPTTTFPMNLFEFRF
ncbi:hypothetical protein SOVF_160700 isoform B [Spinacia oleracea]|nr:hypothetical protein SOVF_160700 isoform B [Spinacia oleracea]